MYKYTSTLIILLSLSACSIGPKLNKMSCSELRDRESDLKAQQKQTAIDTVITGIGTIASPKDKDLESDFETNSALNDITSDALKDTRTEISRRGCK